MFEVLHYGEALEAFSVPHLLAEGIGYVVGHGAAAIAAPVLGAGIAGVGAATSIYGSIHGAEVAHEEGRAIGQAAAYGNGYVERLLENAGGPAFRPRSDAEARGAARADRVWTALPPAERVALQSPELGRAVLSALARAVLDRATGHGE